MMRALFTGASGMRGQQTRIDVVSNNLANVNTTGFKSGRAEFADLIYQQLRRPGGTSATGQQWPTELQVGLGVQTVGTSRSFTQGSLIQTDQPLDLSIQGDGFFQVALPTGEIAYTRDGSFHRDGGGNIVNNFGYMLEPGIVVPEDLESLTIMQDGTVLGRSPGDAEDTQLGQIEIVRFVNPQGLEAMGHNLYRESGASGAPQAGVPGEGGLGTLAQGMLENSNVSVVDELVSLITSQRAYEANSRSVQTSDEMLQTAVNLKR